MMVSLPAQYSAVDILSVAAWTVFIAVSFLVIGYAMGRRDDIVRETKDRIVDLVKSHEPEPEPEGDFWDDHVPTAINERGRD